MRNALPVIGFILLVYGFGYYRGAKWVKETVKHNLENAARKQDTIVATINHTTCIWIPTISIKSQTPIKQ